ncbi:sulfate permease [Ascidiimonas sp. W6]|uniref:SulP family inorganic anion transporter n=1 Tax=Ascidiimonas meishanensis TaxID=3128903 RepID=UPI0030EF154C
MLKRFFPILTWLPQYKKSYLSGDITAGITVGVMVIPQGMAYAMIAGLPPIYGLYAALLPTIVYSITGTSRRLSVGPVAMDSLLVASGLGALSISGIESYVAMAAFLALFIGVIQLGLGFINMGFMVNFLSKPVISGFTSAAAIIIGLSQLKHVFGLEIKGSSQLHQLLKEIFIALDQTHLKTLLIGVAAILVILLLKKIHKKIPGSLLVVILGICLIYFMRWDQIGVAIVGSIPEGLPSLKIPKFSLDTIYSLTPIAITLALIGFLEAVSVAKALDDKHRDGEIDANQELRAIGSANLIGGFFQSFPVTGSFSRTALNDDAGANTAVASLISAFLVGITLIFLTPLFYYLPKAILGAIIMVAVYGLIDIKYPIRLYRKRKDEFILLICTFLITLILGIKEGILLGVLLSLLLLVYRTSKPHIAVLGRIAGTDYYKNINRFNEDIEIREDILVVRFDAQLFFGNKDYFKKELRKQIALKGPSLKAIVLNAEAINYMDSSATLMLIQLIQDLKKQGIRFMIAGAIGPTRDIIFRSELIELVGSENLFVRTFEAVESFEGRSVHSPIQQKVSQQSQN